MPAQNIPGVGHLLVGNGQTGESMRRALQLKGEIPDKIEHRFDPSVTVEDLTRPEYQWLRRTASYHRGATIAAVAGQFPFIHLGNVPGALQAGTVQAIVWQILLSNPQAANLFCNIGYTTTALPAVLGANAGIADDRQAPIVSQNGAYQVAVSNSAVNILNAQDGLLVMVPGNQTLIIPVNFNMSNRFNLSISSQAFNTGMQATFFWRERQLMTTET